MPSQQKQVLEYYQKNPSAAASLQGSIYEEKIINLIKQKAKVTKKTISTEEAERILKLEHEKKHKHVEKKSIKSDTKTVTKKSKKTSKSSTKKKKIRKK